VGVMNGRLPVEGATVRFTIVAPGDGRLGSAKQPTLDVETDSQGIAGAQWWLGKAAHSQEVEVRLLDAFGNEVATQTPLHFYASLSTADAVAYDPSACNKLAGKDTVQDAIDELCKQMDGGGTCTVTAFPGDDLQAAVDSLPAAGGELCLAAGEYLLDAPLRVSARTRVLIAGRGPATLLRARSSETAIAVTLCDAVTIRDLRVEGSGGPQPPGEGHLLGTITIDRSRSVDVLDCELSCAPAAGRARACLTYYGMALGAPEPNIRIVAAPPAGRIRLKGNRLNVGAFQTGILLVDVYEAIVADNHIRLGDPFAGPTIRKRDVHMLAFQADEIGRAVAAISRIAQAPRPELGGRVEDIVSLRNPGGIQAVRGSVSQVMDRLRATGAAEDLRKGTVELIKDVQQTGVARAPKETAQAVAVLAGELSAAGQGIVVAGDTAGTVQICDNVIDDAIQGIHVGISNRRTPVRERGSEVLISGNAVHLLVPSGWREDRHAVFVSNFDTASVVNTTATLRRPLPELLKLLGQASDVDLTRIDQTPVDGIRVIGELGYCMVVRGSSLREFATGVRVVPHPADPGGGIKGPGRRLWLVTETAAVGAVQAVDAPSPAVLQAMNFNPPG
jgi:hypothetical protein